MADNVIVRVPEQQFIRGEDGYSPEVTIENIDHGHSVTITDRDHPNGQNFNVLDGDSAYEQAVAGGYTGTEAQFNEELASFKELSEQAADSANRAAGAAFRAQNYERHAGDAEDAARAYADIALIRMNSADQSAQSAAGSASNASRDAGTASAAATTATEKAGEASDSATAADGSAKDAEAYAVGKRGGTDVGSTDPAYHNNSKYYAEQAALIVDDVEQVMTPTTIGPTALATFDASVAGMPLKGLTVNIEPVQSGSGDPSPDNVRPITGWTGCNIVATKNIFDIDNATWVHGYLIAADGSISANNRYKYCSNYTPIIGGSKITVSGTRTSVAAAFGTPISFYDDQKTFLSRISTFPTGGVGGYVQVTVDVPEGAAYFRLNMYNASVPVSDFQIEYGDTATDFSPFSSFDVTFPSEAGTVYGGTLDVVNGVLKVTHAITTVSAKTWRYESNYTRFSAGFAGMVSGKYGVRAVPFMCSAFQPIDDGRSLANVPNNSIYGAGTSATVLIKTDTVSTVEDFISTYGNVQIVFELAEPLVYDFTDIPEVTTLLGTNSIWADTDDVTVTYGAYLETVKTHADQLGDSILSAIAPLETSYTASRSYAAGSFLFVGTKFYKVTAAISSGDTITPDTNVTLTTVAEQLMALANV